MGDHRLVFELDRESYDPQSISSQSPSHVQSASVRCGAPRWLQHGRWAPDGGIFRMSCARQRRRCAVEVDELARNSEAQPVSCPQSGAGAGARRASARARSSSRRQYELLLLLLTVDSTQAELRNCGLIHRPQQHTVVADARSPF